MSEGSTGYFYDTYCGGVTGTFAYGTYSATCEYQDVLFPGDVLGYKR